MILKGVSWWTWRDSNPRPLPCHGSALPTAPQARSGVGTNTPRITRRDQAKLPSPSLLLPYARLKAHGTRPTDRQRHAKHPQRTFLSSRFGLAAYDQRERSHPRWHLRHSILLLLFPLVPAFSTRSWAGKSPEQRRDAISLKADHEKSLKDVAEIRQLAQGT